MPANEDLENAYIRCPRCELNFIKKKDKLCSVCKREVEAAFHRGEEDDDFGMDFDICPICKTNFIRDDEDICASCARERDLDKSLNGDLDDEDEISSRNWNDDDVDDDIVKPEDEYGAMVGEVDADDMDLGDLDLDIDLGDDVDFDDVSDFDDENEFEDDSDFDDDLDDDFDEEEDYDDDDDLDDFDDEDEDKIRD